MYRSYYCIIILYIIILLYILYIYIIATHNIYDCILDNYVPSAACNPSSHNIVSLSIAVTILAMSLRVNAIQHAPLIAFCLKHQYQLVLDNELQLLDIKNSAYSCTNWNCQCTQYKDGLDSLCH